MSSSGAWPIVNPVAAERRGRRSSPKGSPIEDWIACFSAICDGVATPRAQFAIGALCVVAAGVVFSSIVAFPPPDKPSAELAIDVIAPGRESPPEGFAREARSRSFHHPRRRSDPSRYEPALPDVDRDSPPLPRGDRFGGPHLSWATANGQPMRQFSAGDVPDFVSGETFVSMHGPVAEVWYQEDAGGQRYLWIDARSPDDVLYRTHGYDRRRGEKYRPTATSSADAWTGRELLLNPPQAGWEAVAYP